jgi:lysophospholipase L1-like esterase
MPRSRAARTAAVLAALLLPGRAAPAFTILAVGDSITAGIVKSGRGASHPAQHDPEGGYPARLAALLGPGVRVVGRGAGGASTGFWLDPPTTDPKTARRFLETLWPDLHADRDLRAGESTLSWVLDADRPDLVLVFIGINDLMEHKKDPGGPAPAPVAERIAAIVRRARTATRPVLAATLIPNKRDATAVVAAVNARLRELEPAAVGLDEAFANAGGEALLGDEVHPNAQGQALIARTFADALRDRRLLPPAQR